MGTAAGSLEGIVLPNNWKVTKKLTSDKPGTISTGGNFSICYEVVQDNQKAFLKALDLNKLFMSNHELNYSITKILADATEKFEHEKSVLELCRDNNLSKIITIFESGEIDITKYKKGENYFPYQVPYLIFELADSDVRHKIVIISNKIDTYWKFSSIHNVAVGLMQLSRNKISMQDLKPSNILVKSDESKIGDLGRVIVFDKSGPYNNLMFSGDYNYAPPEICYNYNILNSHVSYTYHDIYMLGNLMIFYFSGHNMTNLLKQRMYQNHGILPFNSENTEYKEIQHIIEVEYEGCLLDISDVINLDFEEIKKDLMEAIKSFCHPNPLVRGILKKSNFTFNTPVVFNKTNYFENIVSKLDTLRKKAKYNLKVK